MLYVESVSHVKYTSQNNAPRMHCYNKSDTVSAAVRPSVRPFGPVSYPCEHFFLFFFSFFFLVWEETIWYLEYVATSNSHSGEYNCIITSIVFPDGWNLTQDRSNMYFIPAKNSKANSIYSVLKIMEYEWLFTNELKSANASAPNCSKRCLPM